MRSPAIICAAGAVLLSACGSDGSADEAPLTVAVTSSAEPTTSESTTSGSTPTEPSTDEDTADPATTQTAAASSTDEATSVASTDGASQQTLAVESEPVDVFPGADANMDQATRELCVAFLEMSNSPSPGPAQVILDRLGDNPPPGVAEELQNVIDTDGQTDADYEATPMYVAPICGLNPADFSHAG